MGWTFTADATRKDVIRELTEDSSSVTTHAKCLRGNVLWAIQTNEVSAEKGYDDATFIGCYLLGRDPGFGWGYKAMTESMGPAETSCPITYLDRVPQPPGEFAAGWRARVRAEADRKKAIEAQIRSASIGDVVELNDVIVPNQFRLRCKKPLLGTCRETGMTYRIPRKFIQSIIQD